jgi:hypothetical protein
MARIAANHKRLMKKDVLSFLGRHAVAFPVLVGIGFVPVKTDAVLEGVQGRHTSSIQPTYTRKYVTPHRVSGPFGTWPYRTPPFFSFNGPRRAGRRRRRSVSVKASAPGSTLLVRRDGNNQHPTRLDIQGRGEPLNPFRIDSRSSEPGAKGAHVESLSAPRRCPSLSVGVS